ncbi:MAG: thioredoxin family protein [Gammaproteobacteria bacterium]|nr:thioredoxin family protein [Gammaproteobacteria bacterium]
MRTAMRAAALLTAVLVAAPSAADGVVFQNLSVGKAFSRAETERKLVLLYYATTWCAPCRVLEATTFEDPEVAAWVAEHTVAVKLDGDHARGLAARFDIGKYPSLVFVDADRQVLDRVVGSIDATRFLAFAGKVLAGRYAVHPLVPLDPPNGARARSTESAPHT